MRKISIANGTYIGQDGQQKTNWVKVGVIGVSQNGKEYVLLDPTINLAGFKREDGKDMVMCTVYDDTQQNSNPQGGNTQQQGGYQQQPAQTYQAPHGQVPVYNEQVPHYQNNQGR